jgi:hypothetical protein
MGCLPLINIFPGFRWPIHSMEPALGPTLEHPVACVISICRVKGRLQKLRRQLRRLNGGHQKKCLGNPWENMEKPGKYIGNMDNIWKL